MNVDEYIKLQDTIIDANKESYTTDNDGVRHINIVNCDRMYWNASAICEILAEDLGEMDNRIRFLSFSKLSNMLCRIINTNDTARADKKIKDWIIRNYKTCSLNYKNNRELNKLIRSKYVFYYDNKHNVLYK